MLLRILMSSAHLETALTVKISTTPTIYQYDAFGKEIGIGGLQAAPTTAQIYWFLCVLARMYYGCTER